MADTDQIPIVELGVADASAGLALSTEAHWNQNEADWRFFLAQGIVFGVRHRAELVATAALLPYSSGNAWISMVLVTAEWRRRGVATRLVDACLDAAAKRGLTAWLDATPAGANVYGPLGFTPTLSNCSLDQLIARDRTAMGFDRRPLLTEFAGRAGSRILTDGHAMALVRDGRTTRQIGPMFADTPQAALGMIEAIVRSEAGPRLIDVVHSQDEFLKGLTAAGWNIERPFQRMRFGRAGTQGAELPFAVAGPEFG